MLTLEQIKYLCPNNKSPEALLSALNKILPKYSIDTPERVSSFLSQTIHESAQYTRLVENLNYSAQGLMKTWKKRFPTPVTATPYHRKPEKIANRVYADRMGNGSEASGDGWKYRGRGCIQLTGKENYTKFAKFMGKSLDETVAYCETLEGAIESGCWFWSINNLNTYADKKDVKGLTKAINGGDIGLTEREELYEVAIQVV
jgi:putative chitinase